MQLYISLLVLIAAVTALDTTAEITVTVTPQKYAALPGDVFPVEYTVSWTDSDGNCVVLPPELPALEWGTAAVLDMHTADQETRFIVGCRADNSGTYTLPALTIRLAKDLDPAATDIAKLDDTVPTQVIESDPVQVVFRKPRTALWISGLVVVFLVGIGVVAYRQRKGRRAETDVTSVSPLEQAQELLHQARRSRLDGDFYAFYRALHSALTCIAAHSPEPHTVLREKIKRAIDDTGYRGMRPSDDVLEGDFRDVERIVAQEQQRDAKEN